MWEHTGLKRMREENKAAYGKGADEEQDRIEQEFKAFKDIYIWELA